MSIYATPSAGDPLARLLSGYESALDRLDVLTPVVAPPDSEPQSAARVESEVFIALAETLMWLMAVDEHIHGRWTELRAVSAEEQLVTGLRWARNEATHGMQLAAGRSIRIGGSLPFTPGTLGSAPGLTSTRWIFAPLPAELDSDTRLQISCYRRFVAGEMLTPTIRQAREIVTGTE